MKLIVGADLGADVVKTCQNINPNSNLARLQKSSNA